MANHNPDNRKTIAAVCIVVLLVAVFVFIGT